MAITLARCDEHIRHVLRRELSEEIDTAEIANVAGEWLVAAHAWSWLDRSPASLDFVAAQEYVTLPTDFAELRAIQRSSIVADFTLTTLNDVQRRRSKQIWASTELAVWGAVVTNAGSGSGPPTPRLEIYPTPGANTTGALLCVYRAGWTRLMASDQVHATLPPFMEPVYLEALRGFAESWEKGVPIGERLVSIQPLLQAAMRRDSADQFDFGPIQNGAVAAQYTRYSNVSPWRMSIP